MTAPTMNGASAGHEAIASDNAIAMTASASRPRPIASGETLSSRLRKSAQRTRARARASGRADRVIGYAVAATGAPVGIVMGTSRVALRRGWAARLVAEYRLGLPACITQPG